MSSDTCDIRSIIHISSDKKQCLFLIRSSHRKCLHFSVMVLMHRTIEQKESTQRSRFRKHVK